MNKFRVINLSVKIKNVNMFRTFLKNFYVPVFDENECYAVSKEFDTYGEALKYIDKNSFQNEGNSPVVFNKNLGYYTLELSYIHPVKDSSEENKFLKSECVTKIKNEDFIDAYIFINGGK